MGNLPDSGGNSTSGLAGCDGRGIQLHNGERSLGGSAKASRQISGRFEMDLQY